MKKAFSFIMVVVLVAALVILVPIAFAAPEEITLNAGDSLSDALNDIADNGTIVVDGIVVVTEALGAHAKTVTIKGGASGGELDFTGLTGDICLGDHITFDKITLKFTENANLFAGGYTVKMEEGVDMPNAIKIYGGKREATVVSTNLTLLGGEYSEIYGGSYNGNVIGDTHLYVGGKANSTCDESSHDRLNVIYGGSRITSGSKTIGGTAYTVFTGDAKANYLYGGNYGSGTIIGGTDITVSGGKTMAVYGANGSGDYIGDAKLEISGGTMEQVFGGSEGGSMTGDVALDITGGTITRRVYGGCYNEVSWLGEWSTSRYVDGTITLTLYSGATIDYSFTSNEDNAIYARSRHEDVSGTEVSHLVYADQAAKTKFENNLKKFSYMSGVSTADHIHYHTYTASGAVITQNCIDSKCSASATVAVEGTPVYNGTAVTPAKVTYSGDWFGGELDVAYAGNDQVGTGTASITCGGVTASCNFTIAAPSMTMNGESYGSLEDAIAAARQTEGADTITLEKDLELSSGLVIDTDVTLTADKEVTITAAASQTGGMFRIIGGTFTIESKSKITLNAGENTTHVISNNGGNVVLTNVQLVGNQNKACGIFNYEGTTTAERVAIKAMSDGIYVMDGTIVNVDDVTISDSGRYGIKVKGTLNITNDVDKVAISGSVDHAIDVENGGEVTCNAENAVEFSNNAKKNINVRNGGNFALSCESEEN